MKDNREITNLVIELETILKDRIDFDDKFNDKLLREIIAKIKIKVEEDDSYYHPLNFYVIGIDELFDKNPKSRIDILRLIIEKYHERRLKISH